MGASVRREKSSALVLCSSAECDNPLPKKNTMIGIRKAIGFGIFVLILRLLLNDVFHALENTTVGFLNTANTIFSNIGSTTPINPAGLIPH